MSVELEGLRNIVETARAHEAERRKQYEATAQFYGATTPFKPSRSMRLSWWLRDRRRRVAEFVYPEGKDEYDPYW